MPACLQDGLSADRLKLQRLSVQAETRLQVELSKCCEGGRPMRDSSLSVLDFRSANCYLEATGTSFWSARLLAPSACLKNHDLYPALDENCLLV